MDKNIVITQLVNAAITIIVTIVVVRFTMKGSLGISQTFTHKLKSTARRYVEIVGTLLGMLCVSLLLYQLVGTGPNALATRLDVLMISTCVAIAAHFLYQLAGNLVALRDKDRPPNVQQ